MAILPSKIAAEKAAVEKAAATAVALEALKEEIRKDEENGNHVYVELLLSLDLTNERSIQRAVASYEYPAQREQLAKVYNLFGRYPTWTITDLGRAYAAYLQAAEKAAKEAAKKSVGEKPVEA